MKKNKDGLYFSTVKTAALHDYVKKDLVQKKFYLHVNLSSQGVRN